MSRRRFQDFLAEFRAAVVLVPFDDNGGLFSIRLGGIRWIMAFSDEGTLSGFLLMQQLHGERGYRAVLGARLLDNIAPAVPGPCGVALDAGSEEGSLLPPVSGVVPEQATVEQRLRAEGNESRGMRA
ncbi:MULTISPECIES: SseB family protein [unclassified Streptomyces]|uniref:SseB family protein n=1 Tax=unclassified Streptomyces TaxID=2593676 RepID=UPI0023ED1F2A|nr:SseB family protein [Streptomyces sp. WMMB303]MDF4254577.1 SseB family protein [Streptomyces sp. WMMB303]